MNQPSAVAPVADSTPVMWETLNGGTLLKAPSTRRSGR